MLTATNPLLDFSGLPRFDAFRPEYVAPAILAWAACAAGEQDEAIRCGREAHAIGDPSLTAAKYWPDFADLRKDGRFGEILISRGWK